MLTGKGGLGSFSLLAWWAAMLFPPTHTPTALATLYIFASLVHLCSRMWHDVPLLRCGAPLPGIYRIPRHTAMATRACCLMCVDHVSGGLISLGGADARVH